MDYLKNIFESKELVQDSIISNMETTATEGKMYLTAIFTDLKPSPLLATA